MPKFTYIEAGAQKTIDLSGDLIVVGSDAACQVVIADPQVSPVHCEFRRGANGWRVVDLESRAGTSVNGEFVNQRVLSEGDVIQIAGVRGTVTGVARAGASAGAEQPGMAGSGHSPARVASPPPLAAPAAPSRAPLVQRPVPSRAGAGATRGRTSSRADGREGAEDRRPRRKKDSGSALLVIGGAILGLGILAYLVVPNKTLTLNYGLRTQMLAAERKNNWDEVVRLASQADPNDVSDYNEIQAIKKRAERGLHGDAAGVQNDAALKDWNAIAVWWQGNDFKDKAGYEQRLDEYLTTYGQLGSPGPMLARQDRIKYFGSAAPRGVIPPGEPGFPILRTDVEFLGAAGRFGEAIERLDGWWRQNATVAPMLSANVDSTRAQLVKAASNWVDKQIVVARQQFDRGEKTKARGTLRRAAESVGIPELSKRAQDAMNTF